MEEKALSLAERIEHIATDSRLSDQTKTAIVNRMKRTESWYDLMANLAIQVSPEEARTWAEDLKTFSSATPSAFLNYMSTWKTPDDQVVSYAWNSMNLGKMPAGIVGGTSSSIRYVESYENHRHASEYIQYLRLLHNYIGQVEVPKQVFSGIDNSLYNIEGWHTKALMNGSLLYRKLLEDNAIQFGEKLNLWKSFSRTELMGLVGLDANGREMTAEQQATFMKGMVKTYEINGGKKAEQDEPLPEMQVEPIKEKTPSEGFFKAEKVNGSLESFDLAPELTSVICQKIKALTLRKKAFEKWSARLPKKQRFWMMVAGRFVLNGKLDRLEKKYDKMYAETADRLYPPKSLMKTTREFLRRVMQPVVQWLCKNKKNLATIVKEDIGVIKQILQEIKNSSEHKSEPEKRKPMHQWRTVRANQPQPGKSAETPIVGEGFENGNMVTTLFYTKSNKIVRITTLRNGLKKIDTIIISRDEGKQNAICGRVATYYERTRTDIWGRKTVEHLASLTGEMQNGKAGVYVNPHDGIARRISYLSIREFNYWKRQMEMAKARKIMIYKQAVLGKSKPTKVRRTITPRPVVKNDHTPTELFSVRNMARAG
ncbi:MAG: hypothetical protein J6Y85_02685 [Alphaproteobacteria bacterium]|nr:hypothetical protein [Alphaproteobacteria bacterium]